MGMVPLFEIHLAIEPVAKERPRVNRKSGTIYTPSKTATYERTLAKLLKAAGPVLNESDDLQLDCQFGFGDQKRRDGDNCYKAAADAANKVLFQDDSQITQGSFRVAYGVEEPYVALQLFSLGPRPSSNARSRAKKKPAAAARALPTGYDLCPACQKRAKRIATDLCRECSHD